MTTFSQDHFMMTTTTTTSVSIVNYDKNPTVLNKSIENLQWKSVALRCQRHPKEASTWTYKYNIKHDDYDGSSSSSSDKTIKWCMLPIHQACSYGCPQFAIGSLIEAYPDGLKKRCFLMGGGSGSGSSSDDDDAPIHCASYWGVDNDVMMILLMGFPDSIDIPDPRGRTPLDIARQSKCDSRKKAEMISLLRKFARRQREITNMKENITEGHDKAMEETDEERQGRDGAKKNGLDVEDDTITSDEKRRRGQQIRRMRRRRMRRNYDDSSSWTLTSIESLDTVPVPGNEQMDNNKTPSSSQCAVTTTTTTTRRHTYHHPNHNIEPSSSLDDHVARLEIENLSLKSQIRRLHERLLFLVSAVNIIHASQLKMNRMVREQEERLVTFVANAAFVVGNGRRRSSRSVVAKRRTSTGGSDDDEEEEEEEDEEWKVDVRRRLSRGNNGRDGTLARKNEGGGDDAHYALNKVRELISETIAEIPSYLLNEIYNR